jgi:CHRD domain/PEP-CTERM motif
MMKFNMLTAGLLLATIAAPAAAVDSVFKAELNGSTEVPPNDSPGTGAATVTINKDQGTMHVHESFSGLLKGTTDSHIHCCTTAPHTGNAIIATPLTGFAMGVTSGSYDHTFNMHDASSYNEAFINTHGGTPSQAFDALIAGVTGGNAYGNIHTTLYPDGEIRGFLTPAIPEPETYAMFLAGLGVMGALVRRRRR